MMQEKESAMREILFKARRVDNGEWVEGFYVFDETHVIVKSLSYEIRTDGKVNQPEVYMIDPATLCQYIGLTDKNGVKIFEGDIVKWGHADGYREHPIRIAIVQINPDIQFDAGFTVFNYGSFAYAGKTDKALEVCGSIHTTPELMGEREREV